MTDPDTTTRQDTLTLFEDSLGAVDAEEFRDTVLRACRATKDGAILVKLERSHD